MISLETEAVALRGAWFGHLEPELRRYMLDRAEERSFPAAEAVCLQGEPGTGIHLLLEGRIHLCRTLGNERNLLIHVGQAGFWFGEWGALTGERNYLTAQTVQSSRVMSISAAHLLAAIETEPKWHAPIAQLWLSQLRWMLQMLEQTRRPGTIERIAARLWILAEIDKNGTHPRDPILLQLTQAELGMLSDLSRQHTNRALRALEREGLVQLGQSRIVIPDPVALAIRASDGG